MIASIETKIGGFGVRIRENCGPTVLWVHGYTLDSSTWEELWSLLPFWRHAGLDLPGHGLSNHLPGISQLPELAQQIGGAAIELGARHLVGISFGAMIALQVAMQFSSQFKSLTLGSTAIAGGFQDPYAQQRNIEILQLYRLKGAGPWLTELWMQSPPDIFKGASHRPALFNRLRQVVDRHPWRELEEGSMHFLCNHHQDANDLRKIRAATLIMIGEEDMPSFKRNAELLRRSLSICRKAYIESAGHLCMLELPEVAAALIGAHLKATE